MPRRHWGGGTGPATRCYTVKDTRTRWRRGGPMTYVTLRLSSVRQSVAPGHFSTPSPLSLSSPHTPAPASTWRHLLSVCDVIALLSSSQGYRHSKIWIAFALRRRDYATVTVRYFPRPGRCLPQYTSCLSFTSWSFWPGDSWFIMRPAVLCAASHARPCVRPSASYGLLIWKQTL